MSNIPDGVKMPQDRKKSAAQIEAEKIETIEITWRDFTFTVDATAENWLVETTLAFEEGKAASGVRGILGAKQWAELMKSKPRNNDISDLFAVIANAMGLNTSGE